MRECCKICGRNGDLIYGRNFTEGNSSLFIFTHEPSCLDCLKRLVLFGKVSPSEVTRQNVAEFDTSSFPVPGYPRTRIK